MADESLRRACYLAALSRLQRGLAHDARSHLGSIALQFELIGELLERESPPGEGLARRLKPAVERGRAGLERARRDFELAIGTLAPPAGEVLDLGACLAELEALIAAGAADRPVRWPAEPGASPALRVAHPAIAREALSIAAIEMTFANPPGGPLEVSLDSSRAQARVSFAGAMPPHDACWRRAVEESLASLGGSVRDGEARLELVFPLLPMD